MDDQGTRVTGFRRRQAGLVLALGMIAIALTPAPGGAEEPVHVLFERLDLNGDGVISFAEFETVAERRAARIDANGDGYITRQEFLDYQERRARAAACFRRLAARRAARTTRTAKPARRDSSPIPMCRATSDPPCRARSGTVKPASPTRISWRIIAASRHSA